MKPVENWRRVVALSLSFWMQVAGVLALILPEILFAATGIDTDPVMLWWLGILLLVAGIIGRLYQQGLSKWREWSRIVAVGLIVTSLAFLLANTVRAAPPTEAETLDVAVPFIMEKEGIRLTAYRDIVGVPTICGGITSAAGIKVTMGMKMSLAECNRLMRVKVAEYRRKLHVYFVPKTLSIRLTPQRDTAYTSLAFNAGIGSVGRSTATRRLNAGDIAGGCQALTWWNKAGGRVIRGLVIRRAEERDLCMLGL